MRTPRSIKRFEARKRDRRGRHTKADRIAKYITFKDSIKIPTCRGCNTVLDTSIHTKEGDAVVCTTCGLVDDNICFDHEAPVLDHLPHSPFYMHKNYYAEKLLQARNKEPRFRDRELDIMSVVFDIFRDKCPLVWSEEHFTKSHCAQICRLITKHYPKSPFVRRVERWYQYRTYICGVTYGEMSESVATQLRCLFDAFSYFFLLYLQENSLPKRNITQLDLVTLVLLYNLSKYDLAHHGWYFLNHNIVNKTKSVYRDIERIQTICDCINQRILTIKYTNNILPQCYQWFRSGNTLKVPDVDSLLDMALYSPLGAIQFAAHKTKFDAGIYAYRTGQHTIVRDALSRVVQT